MLKLSDAKGTVAWATSDSTVAIAQNAKSTQASIYPRGSGSCAITATDEAGRTVVCAVTSTYESPAPTGEMITLRFGGEVTILPSYGKYIGNPSGIILTLYSRDGRELGIATTNSEGRFLFEVTIDNADYFVDEFGYFLNGTFMDEDGISYSTLNRDDVPGVKLTLHSSERAAPYDHTKRNIIITVTSDRPWD